LPYTHTVRAAGTDRLYLQDYEIRFFFNVFGFSWILSVIRHLNVYMTAFRICGNG